jgi:hypothetical protein
LIKISQNSPCLKDLILFQTDISDDDDNYKGNYSNIGVSAILQNCSTLECLELGGGGDWYDESILDKGMFLNMSCFNLKRVCLGNLQMIDDAAVILLCDSIERLEEFVIERERGDERCLTTHTSIDYLIDKFSGSLSLFIDQCHYYSAIEIENFAVVLDHIVKIQLRFDYSNDHLDSTQVSLESRFKSLCNSKHLNIIEIDICCREHFCRSFRRYSHLSWWDCMERRVIPTYSKIHWIRMSRTMIQDFTDDDDDDNDYDDDIYGDDNIDDDDDHYDDDDDDNYS